MNSWTVRAERPGDASAIRRVIEAAFAGHRHSNGREPAIVDRLRTDGDLATSLVAEENGSIVGHVAFSPVTVSGRASGWYGLGPVSVMPARQRVGIGSQLISEGLTRLRRLGAEGCVVLGEPGYYARFGFSHDPALRYPGPPSEYFQRLTWADRDPDGEVRYAAAFG
jgi:putative acetyltransferase